MEVGTAHPAGSHLDQDVAFSPGGLVHLFDHESFRSFEDGCFQK
jgi:hypothetical protein